jgi:PAS domain S-box-containing protein
MSVFYTEQDKRDNVPRQNLNEALKNNIHETEGWRIRKDGSRFWANIVFNTIYDENGFLTGFAKITRDISTRKKTDDQKSLVNAELERRVKIETQKIITHERRFRKLIENSNDGISLFDKNRSVFYRSRSAQRINGWTDVEISGKKMTSLIHPDDVAGVEKLFDTIHAKPDSPIVATYRTLHKQGHYIWIESLLTNRLNDPDINAIVCNFRDVSERIMAEEQVKDKNKQIENIFDSITDGFIALDYNFRYTYANRQIGEMLGCDPASLIGAYIWDKYPDAVGSVTYNAFQKAMHTQQYICNEDYYAPLSLWQENHIYPSADGLSVFIRDITERKLAEGSLVQSESNLRSIFENTDLAIVLFDMQANILSFNNNASILADQHFHKQLKTGLSAFHYCSINRRPYVRQVLQHVQHASPIVYEVSYPLTDNQVVWYEVRWVNVMDQEKKPIGIILTLKDITGKKQADIERDRITADLIQRNKDLEQFTYIISHNLRAPVANIKGLSGILLDNDHKADVETSIALQALSTSVHGLDQVILDLNHILQVNSAVNDTLETISLSQIMNEICTVSNRLIKKNNAVINFTFNEVAELRTLKSYLYSIFQNLLVNSIKYRKVDVAPVISVSSQLDDNKVCIRFADNGKGIDLERYGNQLFGLYKRFDLSVEGKGMGLFMVKTQVERLGGKISVQSRLSEGTIFKLEFPLNNVN